MLRIPGLAAQPGLVHGFSTMALGDMRAGPNGRALTAPRLAFAEALGVEPGRLVIAGEWTSRRGPCRESTC